jgi:Mg-chelatase subunit ChlI
MVPLSITEQRKITEEKRIKKVKSPIASEERRIIGSKNLLKIIQQGQNTEVSPSP